MTLERFARPAAAALVTLLLITLLRTAWVSDDAMITLRTLMNFEHGYGLRFNIDERVQAYTHPLWLFVLLGWESVVIPADFVPRTVRP